MDTIAAITRIDFNLFLESKNILFRTLTRAYLIFIQEVTMLPIIFLQNDLHGSVFLLLICTNHLIHTMETVRVEHDWARIDEQNNGHTPNEWGLNTNRKIISYKTKWEKN